ncbi:hypothetical protein [Streptomyces sp. NBC_00102]|uniref:hypothetical protein n=1 Tax=Streptomyces sp. NBC_00102 TaxID=2975652 RepID=UPI00225203BC|nr:hypothetical protein [Streptomyces sp. NBC_00102]MCX5398968.1 hypothetical protein [Streptomyces sp. NBC_00102]
MEADTVKVGMVSASAASDPAPAWVTLPLAIVLLCIGLCVAMNFRGLPGKYHESLGGREDRGFFSSFAFQRLIGAGLAAGGIYGVFATTVSLLS